MTTEGALAAFGGANRRPPTATTFSRGKRRALAAIRGASPAPRNSATGATSCQAIIDCIRNSITPVSSDARLADTPQRTITGPR